MPANSTQVLQERISFSGHETFPFRGAWLKKAVDAVQGDRRFFARNDALVHLGVGKNMVRSIRHWGLATGLIAEDPQANDRGRTLRVTILGRRLLDDDGWDPFLEDPASLWLIHAQLVRRESGAATWAHAFGGLRRSDFTRMQLRDSIVHHYEPSYGRINPATLDRDIEVFCRSYSGRRVGAAPAEDSLECPLTDLGLVQPLPEDAGYRFVTGRKPTLPAQLVGYALLQQFERRGVHSEVLQLDDCLYGPESPGALFRLDENSLIEAIERLDVLTDHAIGVDDTAGLRQVYLRRDRGQLTANDFLVSYFDGRTRL